MSCGRDCDCDSEEAHDAWVHESMLDFLRNPGLPPAHYTEEQADRALQGIREAQERWGIK
jgi:hypothetical protein